MRRLEQPEQAAHWLASRVRGALHADSRAIGAGDGFVAWPGAATDGRRFVEAARARGAAACLVEADGVEPFGFQGEDIATYAGLKAATGPIAAAFHGDPSRALDVVAFTGTNGKTSSAWWLAQALSALEPARPCGLVGTLGIGRPPVVQSTGLTTPDPVRLQREFRAFVDAGVTACAIEASSIGIAERRLDGSRVRVAVFTNFTRDHLDYHGDMRSYWAAKAELFDWPGLQAAVVNIDDARGAELAEALAARSLDLWTVSRERAARLAATRLRQGEHGLAFEVHEGTQVVELATRLVGDYNVSNLLGVIASMRALGVPLEAAARACEGLSPVPGRMDGIGGPGEPLVVVDYAHTPDALEKVLQALHPVARARGGRLACVFGCGGDRDASKRPIMAAMAVAGADRVLVTSDNPRTEPPLAIIDQILAGVPEGETVEVEPDRAAAIARAVNEAAPEDVVLVAGKGHEDHQEIAGVRHPFSDRAQAVDALRARALATRAGDAGTQAGTETPGPALPAGAMFTLREASAWVPGARVIGEAGTAVQRVHTDTRSLAAGDLFVALRGERFDAADFLPQAAAAGAVAAVCETGAENGLIASGLPGLLVPDARRALGEIARGWRRRFERPLIAVTGSNGKTTVTQMIASILRAHAGDAAWATRGNLNNEVGLPLTLLGLRPHHRMAVVELGMNHPGEIAWLASVAEPTVALVNNAQREHQEFMATVEAVARENGGVLQALPPEGTAVFPGDDPFTALWTDLAVGRRLLRFAPVAAPGVEVSLVEAAWSEGAWSLRVATPMGQFETRLRIAGRHNLRNALAATACALAAGVPIDAIARGLAAFEPVKGRSRALRLDVGGRTVTLIDDTYNANPDSVIALIDVLAELPGPRMLVLGDMGEVGNQGPAFHAEVGQHARERGIEHLLALGELSAEAVRARGGSARHFNDIEALTGTARGLLPGCASVAVKGSRFMRMERVVEALAADARPVQENAHAA